jgi:hypothetical protein
MPHQVLIVELNSLNVRLFEHRGSGFCGVRDASMRILRCSNCKHAYFAAVRVANTSLLQCLHAKQLHFYNVHLRNNFTSISSLLFVRVFEWQDSRFWTVLVANSSFYNFAYEREHNDIGLRLPQVSLSCP